MPIGFLLKTEGKIKYLTISSFEDTGLVRHCFTTRQGGVSEGYYSTLNLGTHLTDDPIKVQKNRELMCKVLGGKLEQLVAAKQVHGKKVRRITAMEAGVGAFSNEDAFPDTDALMTNETDIILSTYYADCVPLYLLDPINRAIALAHAGWKGTALKIGAETLREMQKEYGTDPKSVLAAVGPSVGPCCYEVDERVLSEFRTNFTGFSTLVSKEGQGKAMLNLWEANRQSFLEAGVLEANITIAELCTCCQNDLFFSYRKEDGKTGRMASMMMLK